MAQASVSRRHAPLQSLATRVILVVFLGTSLTALVVSWVSVRSTFVFLRGELDRALPHEAARAADAVADAWDAARMQLAEAAGASALARTGSSTPAVLERLLADLTPAFEGLVLLDPDGRRLATAGGAASLLPDPRTLRAADGGPLPREASWLGALRTGDAAGVAVAGTAVGRDRTLLGILGLATAPELLATPTSQDEATPRLRLQVMGPLQSAPPRGARVYRNVQGILVVGAARPVADLPWQVFAEQPFRRAFAPVYSVLVQVFVIDACIILLFSILAYQMTAAIVRPIDALSEGARRISQGQLDIEIPEPRGHDEIGLLTRTFNDMARKLLRNQEEIQQAHATLKAQNAELQRANEVLEQLSITDGLTKLHNHRFFQDYLTREIKRVSRTGEPLSMLLIDIDDFKRLNDRLGHSAGDELLVGMALLLNDSSRDADLVARYGGEEFVLLAPETDLEGAMQLAEKIRTTVAESSFIVDESKQLTKMTVSIGVARFRGNRKTFFQAADQALYRAKAAGKNCVVVDGVEAPYPGGPPEVPDAA